MGFRGCYLCQFDDLRAVQAQRQTRVGRSYIFIAKDLEKPRHALEAGDSGGIVSILKLTQSYAETDENDPLFIPDLLIASSGRFLCVICHSSNYSTSPNVDVVQAGKL